MNDEDRMTNAEDRTATLGALLSAFVFCHSFDLRNSEFVIWCGVPRRLTRLGMTDEAAASLCHNAVACRDPVDSPSSLPSRPFT